MKNPTIKIVTRKSPLALFQATFVAQQLEHHHPNQKIEIIGRTTEGDRIQHKPLTAIGGKDLFVKDLQQMLLDKQADIAVHSIKDMSAKNIPGLLLAAFCRREDPRDTLISYKYNDMKSLPDNAIVGTSSPRRECQINSLKHVTIKSIRGNVETRLKKLESGEYDAIILAAAGLKRLNLEKHITEYLEPQIFIPAIGQGAIGIECRINDAHTRELLQSLDDADTRVCVTAERVVNQRLNGDCYTPLAAHAFLKEKKIYLSGMVGSLDGTHIIHDTIDGHKDKAEALGLELGDRLLAQGADRLLNST